MGEVAEMMLEGFLCEGCGDIIGDPETGESQGFPGRCASCIAGSGLKVPLPVHKRKTPPSSGQHGPARKFRCHCNKGFRSAFALEQHQRDTHGTSGFRLTRTGRTVAFLDVRIGSVFFAHGKYWTRIDFGVASALATSDAHGSCCNFITDGKTDCTSNPGKLSEAVEVVTVEGNDR